MLTAHSWAEPVRRVVFAKYKTIHGAVYGGEERESMRLCIANIMESKQHAPSGYERDYERIALSSRDPREWAELLETLSNTTANGGGRKMERRKVEAERRIEEMHRRRRGLGRVDGDAGTREPAGEGLSEEAEGDGPAETEERGGGVPGTLPGAAAVAARGARRAGGQRLPAARGGGGKTKTKKHMDKTHRREGSGSASTPVALRHGRSGLVGGRGQGGGGRTWDDDGQGACDRPSGEPPD
jgi:hypothetical protein